MQKKGDYMDFSINSSLINEMVGRLLIVGFEGTEFSPELENLLTEVRPAGIIFFKRNYRPEGGPQQLSEVIKKAKTLAFELTGRELFVAVDHEGGLVQRFSQPFTKLPSAGSLAALNDPLAAGEFVEGSIRELAGCGFNFNFAPVLDISSPISSFIGNRSFGDNAEQVIAYGREFIKAVKRCGMLAAAKHFPGLGSASLDPHHELPRIDLSKEHLLKVDLLPFEAMIQEGLLAVMTSHAVYPALDDNVATFSGRIINMLKKDMGFKGAVLTDDMEMGAVIKHNGIGQAAVMAVIAGHDLLLVCRRRSLIDECRYFLSEAIARREIKESRLDDAFLRVGRLFEELKNVEVAQSIKLEWLRRLTACQI